MIFIVRFIVGKNLTEEIRIVHSKKILPVLAIVEINLNKKNI